MSIAVDAQVALPTNRFPTCSLGLATPGVFFSLATVHRKLRHLFITNLQRAGLSPKMAQTLARHSDIRLTLGVYAHVELADQRAAICALPAPPGQAEREPL